MPRVTSRIPALAFALAVLVPGPGLAQKAGPAGAKPRPRSKAEQKAYEQRKAEIRKRIQTYRALMRKGEVLRTHVRVRVKLRNGEMMAGVVRDGLFVERPAGLEFVRAEMAQPGAGLRLWYYDQTDGFIFIPYTLIKTYKILKRLSDIEIKEIRDQIVAQAKRARSKGAERKQRMQARQRELREGEKTVQKLAQLTKKLSADKKKQEREKRLLALLDEFPPDEGWGPQKIKQIDLRRITLDVFPGPKERRFIEVFEDWKLGYEIRQERERKAEEKKKKRRRAYVEGGTGKTGTKDPSQVGAKPAGGK